MGYVLTYDIIVRELGRVVQEACTIQENLRLNIEGKNPPDEEAAMLQSLPIRTKVETVNRKLKQIDGLVRYLAAGVPKQIVQTKIKEASEI